MTPPHDADAPMPGLPVSAVARRLGLAPATLRTWDRRYGLGPSSRRRREHRRYTPEDLARLESVQRLLAQGMPIGDAVRAVSDGTTGEVPAAAARRSSENLHSLVRRLREAALRLDSEGVDRLLTTEVDGRGLVDAWEALIRPTLTGIGDRWTEGPEFIAAEHLLSGAVTRVLDRWSPSVEARPGRPVLLLAAPGEAHALPLHVLAAALRERSVPVRLIGAATPGDAAAEAVRRLDPLAVVVWSQRPETAAVEVLTSLPRARGGRLVAAAGPGWQAVELPSRVAVLSDLRSALDVPAPH